MLLATLRLGHAAIADSPTTEGAPDRSDNSANAAYVVGITKPHRTATLASLAPARIADLVVAEGQVVSEGDVLVVLDDGVQRVRTEIAKASAESLIDIDLTRTRLDHLMADLERLQRLNGDDQASSKECRDAAADATVARLKHELARFDHRQAIRDHEYERLLLERLYLRAPFSGYIAETLKEVGETVEKTDGIVRLVKLDPLEISLDCPLSLASQVQAEDRVVVRPLDPQWAARVGQVSFVSRLIDPASQTFKVKLVVTNHDAEWISGLKVAVDFAEVPPHAGGHPNPRPDVASVAHQPAAGPAGIE